MNDKELYEKFGVTKEEIEKRDAEYEGADWSHMEFGEVTAGRPKLYDEPMKTIVVKVPASRVEAIGRTAAKHNETRSAWVRRAIENELVAEA